MVIQNPATARYPSMPMALPPTAVDHVVDLEQIGPLLYELVSGVPAETGDKGDNALQTILGTVSRQANIDFRPYKASTIIRRIGRRMVATQTRTIRDYADYMQGNPQEIGELVAAFLINVTQFFRDPDAFAFLRSEILPALIETARERDHVLRMWSAGCATGEEAYSIAMLITELLGDELPEWSVKIFATDLDESAITFARNGVYPETLLKNLPDDYSERFFERLGGNQGYRIEKALRQMVIFGQQDLSRSAPFPRIDLVMCRNVLIYFTPELQDYVLNQFAFSLRSNTGYLFLGKAESVRPSLDYFQLISKQWKMYRCVGQNPSLARPQKREQRTAPVAPGPPCGSERRSASCEHDRRARPAAPAERAAAALSADRPGDRRSQLPHRHRQCDGATAAGRARYYQRAGLSARRSWHPV